MQVLREGAPASPREDLQLDERALRWDPSACHAPSERRVFAVDHVPPADVHRGASRHPQVHGGVDPPHLRAAGVSEAEQSRRSPPRLVAESAGLPGLHGGDAPPLRAAHGKPAPDLHVLTPSRLASHGETAADGRAAIQASPNPAWSLRSATALSATSDTPADHEPRGNADGELDRGRCPRRPLGCPLLKASAVHGDGPKVIRPTREHLVVDHRRETRVVHAASRGRQIIARLLASIAPPAIPDDPVRCGDPETCRLIGALLPESHLAGR